MKTDRSNDSTTGAGVAPAATTAATAGRRAASDRRHERVLHAITAALDTRDPTTLTVAAARAAGVHRSFLHRRAELIERLKDAARVGPGQHTTERVTAASLRADLAHARDRALRAEAQVRRLRQRLSEALGQQVWAETGLGPVDEAAELRRDVEQLRQEKADLMDTLDERDDELEAARAANRELISQLNTRP